LDGTPNIRTMGWMDIASPQFADLVQNAVGLIYPSCSEGQAGSVITSLHAGLIPIISRQAGVSVDGFGVALETCEIPEIRRWLLHIRDLPAEELAARALRAWQYARANHTREAFANRYREAVLEILGDRSR
jgi:glycosyltransferase involved in cell wall biosynthesis